MRPFRAVLLSSAMLAATLALQSACTPDAQLPSQPSAAQAVAASRATSPAAIPSDSALLDAFQSDGKAITKTSAGKFRVTRLNGTIGAGSADVREAIWRTLFLVTL